MSWIDLPADDASPQISRLTRTFLSQGKPVPSIMAAMKHNPSAMRAALQLNQAVAFGNSVLGTRREELIATTVSALNDCFY
jgi:hypothetical protein